MSRVEHKYNKIIGVLEDGALMIIEDTFTYGDNLHGATGWTMGLLRRDAIEQAREDEKDRDSDLRFCWRSSGTSLGWENWLQQARAEARRDGRYYILDDSSFRDETTEAYNELDEETRRKIDEAMGRDSGVVDWESWSCGRCVELDESKYKLIIDADALEAARRAEREGVVEPEE